MEVNKLIEIAKRCGTGVCHPACSYNKEFCMESLINALAEELEKDTPVGRWIKASAYNDGVINTVYCTVCKTYQPIGKWDYIPYCPYCGAKMEGEEDG